MQSLKEQWCWTHLQWYYLAEFGDSNLCFEILTHNTIQTAEYGSFLHDLRCRKARYRKCGCAKQLPSVIHVSEGGKLIKYVSKRNKFRALGADWSAKLEALKSWLHFDNQTLSILYNALFEQLNVRSADRKDHNKQETFVVVVWNLHC